MSRPPNNYWSDGWIWFICILALAALVGVVHYRAQIRDLQRRIAVLEQNK